MITAGDHWRQKGKIDGISHRVPTATATTTPPPPPPFSSRQDGPEPGRRHRVDDDLKGALNQIGFVAEGGRDSFVRRQVCQEAAKVTEQFSHHVGVRVEERDQVGALGGDQGPQAGHRLGQTFRATRGDLVKSHAAKGARHHRRIIRQHAGRRPLAILDNLWAARGEAGGGLVVWNIWIKDQNCWRQMGRKKARKTQEIAGRANVTKKEAPPAITSSFRSTWASTRRSPNSTAWVAAAGASIEPKATNIRKTSNKKVCNLSKTTDRASRPL